MFAEKALDEIKQWRLSATSSQYQLDWRWVEQFRTLAGFDAYWWWAHTGPFNEEEQQQWKQCYTPNPTDVVKERLALLIARSRERELATALAEQREPHLCYPALEIEEVRSRMRALHALDAAIAQEEPNTIVRRLYHEKIEEEVAFLQMIEATHEGESEQFRRCSRQVYPEPTRAEMEYVLARVWREIESGRRHQEASEVSQRLADFMQEQLHLTPETLSDTSALQEEGQDHPEPPLQMISAQGAKRFFETVLRESGYEGWQVVIDKASSTRVESGLRRVILADSPMPLERVRHYFIHELGGHVARAIAGERSKLGLLGIGTKNYSTTEEGLALYHERQIAAQHGYTLSDWGTLLGTLSTGLASGVLTPPQSFLALYTFLEAFFLLRRLLKRQEHDLSVLKAQAQKTALTNCLRTFRGVPDLRQKGVCLTKDVVYLRGLWMIEQAAVHDPTALEQLAAGKVALEYLPDLRELGIVASPSPLAKLAHVSDPDAYILSFEGHEQSIVKPA